MQPRSIGPLIRWWGTAQVVKKGGNGEHGEQNSHRNPDPPGGGVRWSGLVLTAFIGGHYVLIIYDFPGESHQPVFGES